MPATTQMDVYASLNNILSRDPSQLNQSEKAELEELFNYCREGMDTDSQKLLGTLLIKAFNSKIHSEAIGENIYLNKYEISQIQLFDILIAQFPFVRDSQRIINREFADQFMHYSELTLIDIGIGMGTQVMNILSLCREMSHLKHVHIVGIEPFGDALRLAGQQIMQFAEQLPFEVSFTPIHACAEMVDFKAIPGLTGAVFVNASLALHHIQSAEDRHKTIASIKSINPKVFMLTEPNVNHYEPNRALRFQSCYHHFYNIFQVIDRLDISLNDKNALKLFFGREIEDIIGKDEQDRYEKHEPATHWINRLKDNHFNINSGALVAPAEKPCGVEIKQHHEGFLGFTFGQETILSVMYAN